MLYISNFLLMKNTKFCAFSFIELLISITILSLLSVVWYTAFQSQQEKSLNSKVTTDIQVLQNALLLSQQENNSLAMPEWNNNFFWFDTSYSHSYDDPDTFGVHWFITDKTLAKKYINILPLDPRTNSYYAYGKTKQTQQYQIAGVIFKNDSPESKVIWNYDALDGPLNLIREYNGSYFIEDGSLQHFPYNPHERVLSAKIWATTGNIKVNDIEYSSYDTIKNIILHSWDTISVQTGVTATLYFSDGSISMIWDDSQETSLTLQKLEFPEKNNLITKIQLILQSWMIWNKASHLDDESEFEIYTIDSTAAVRGTIFGVQKNTNNSKILVIEWNVAVFQNFEENIAQLWEKITNNQQISQEPITGDNITSENGESLIIVENNENPKWILIEKNNQWEAQSDDSTDNIPEEIVDTIISHKILLNENMWFEVTKFQFQENKINTLQLKIPKNIFQSADTIIFTANWEENEINTSEINTSNIQNDQYYSYINFQNITDFSQITSSENNNLKIYLSQFLWWYTYTSKTIEIPLIESSLWENNSWDLPIVNVRDQIPWDPQTLPVNNCNPGDFCWEDGKITYNDDEYTLKYHASYDISWDYNMYANNSSVINYSEYNVSFNSTHLPNYCINNSEKRTSYCVTPNWEKWIFIDAEWNDWTWNDYLKYDWLSVEDFLIEINLRWSAISQPHNTENKSNTIATINGENIKIVRQKENVYINHSNKFICTQNCILSDKYFQSDFYSIYITNEKIIFNWKEWYQKSYDLGSELSHLTNFSLWSDEYNKYQIDDVVNYVKIYEKK